MQSLTLGEISTAIALIAGIIAGLGAICALVSKIATKWLKTGLQPLTDKIDAIDAKQDEQELNRCQDYLVRFLADVKAGDEIGEVERRRFNENLDRYYSLGGNSYIHDEVERLKKAGKL